MVKGPSPCKVSVSPAAAKALIRIVKDPFSLAKTTKFLVGFVSVRGAVGVGLTVGTSVSGCVGVVTGAVSLGFLPRL